MYNVTTTLERNLVISYNTKHTPNIWASHFTPRYLPKRMKACAHTDLYMNIHSNSVCSRLKLETTWRPINRRMENKVWYSHIMEYYSTIKELTIDTFNNVGESQNKYAE